MACYKKILIIFVLLLFLLVNSVFAAEIPLQLFPNAWVHILSGVSVIGESKGRYLSYVPVSSGTNYTIYNDTDVLIYAVAIADKMEYGTKITFVSNIEPGSQYTFQASDDLKYSSLFFYTNNGTTANPRVVLNSSSFSDSIIALTGVVNPFSFWSVFEDSIPYVLLVLVFSLGLYFIIKMLKGLSKGKGRL